MNYIMEMYLKLSSRDHFRVDNFNLILNNINSELQKRCIVYEKVQVSTEFGNLDNRGS